MSRNYGTMTRRNRTRTIVVLSLVLLTLLDSVGGIPYKRSLLRLCSKNLSDALNLACKGRGYNEPFTDSGEDDPQDSVGPGLAEECCYHQCTLTQMLQYCKPEPEGAEDNSIWIEKNSYPSTRPETSSSEERSRSDIEYVVSTIRCKIHGSQKTRNKRTNKDCNDDATDCDRKKSSKKNHGGLCGCRRQRQRRRLLGKLTKTLNKSSTTRQPHQDKVDVYFEGPYPSRTDQNSKKQP